jgi:hypothetical protein
MVLHDAADRLRRVAADVEKLHRDWYSLRASVADSVSTAAGVHRTTRAARCTGS